MSHPSGFHVRHDLQPTLAFELLMLLRASQSQSEQTLREGAAARGYKLRQRKDYGKLISSFQDLNLLTGEKSALALTPLGQTLASIVVFQRDLLPELVHFLYWTVFDTEPDKRFSWSYRSVCDLLWNTAPCIVNRDRLVNWITQAGSDCFNTSNVSFSIQSVAGILNWAEELRPRVLETQENVQYFNRREYCPVELFTLALNHLYQQTNNAEIFYQPITQAFRQAVCRICLIRPESFSDMLVEAETHFGCVHVRRERGDRIAVDGFSWQLLEE